MSSPARTSAPSRLLTATLSGSDRERGRRHGELFGDRAKESGILEFYRGFTDREVFTHLPRPAGRLLDKLHGLFAGRLTPETKNVIEGFAEGSGIDARRIMEGFAMPDVLNFLLGWSGRVLAPTMGCTSAAAWGDSTSDGRLLYARNLDFPGIGTWDRFPLVCRHRPDKGVPYVSVGAAGNIADGITGVNEEGLSVALHQHYSTDVEAWPTGRSILDLGARVLQTARSLDEAVALCSDWKATSGWSLVLTHFKERRACVVQKTARKTAVRWSQGSSLVFANTYDDPALRAGEIYRPPFLESSRLRRKRAEKILENTKGRVDALVLAGLLNDRLDPDRGLTRAFGQAIHQPHTVTSVVMDPERGCLWVSEGAAPTPEGPYRRVALWDDSSSDETLTPADPLPADKRRAYGHYLTAFQAWQDSHDAARANKALQDAVAGDGEDPIYRHMRGLTSLMLGDVQSAADDFEAGAAQPDMSHRRQVQRLWQARSLDLLGRRGEAVKLYDGIFAEGPHPHVRAAAEKGRRAAYRNVKVLPDFIYGDVYAY